MPRNHPQPASPRRRVLPGALALALGAVLLGALPAAADRAMDVLAAAVRAESTVSYRAVADLKIVRAPGQTTVQTSTLYHAPGNRHRTEVTAPPGEAGRLIVRDGRTEWEYWPHAGRVIERQLPAPGVVIREKLDALSAARASLKVTYDGIATVAGRKCHVITIGLSGGRRTGKRVWVDAAQFVELKWERYSSRRQADVTWTVRKITYGPVAGSLFRFAPPSGARVQKVPLAPEMPLADAERQVGFAAVIPGTLPTGYVLSRDRVGIVRFGPVSALWLRFHNGLDTFSLFESPRLGRTPDRMARATRWDTATRTYLLIGRLSQQDRRKIMDSTRG